METTPEQNNKSVVSTPVVDNPAAENQEQAPAMTINNEKLNAYIELLKLDQNLSFAVIAGLAAALVSAALWAAITVATGYQIGYMAIGVGAVVGFVVRRVGKGFDKIFGIAGALLSLVGCMLGNYLSMVAFYATGEGENFFNVLFNIETAAIPDIMFAGFSPMDVLFYGFAIYFGYKFSFRQLSEKEIIANAGE